jgi:xanthine dehydrogenase accessory factor
MLFGGAGEQLGLLSGGCLEAEIALAARKVVASGRANILTYDGSDEDDIAFQLGIGCGGTIDVLLQHLTPQNEYLGLEIVLECLKERQQVAQFLPLPAAANRSHGFARANGDSPEDSFTEYVVSKAARIVAVDGGEWFVNPLSPAPSLLVVGGGIDAQPVVKIARTLGWHIVLTDPRPANARPEHFPDADQLLNLAPGDLPAELLNSVDAVIVMSHKISLDAEALAVLAGTHTKYLALLGPAERRQQVMDMAGLSDNDLPVALSGPAGLHLGGDLPEGIALSILSECHACLHGTSAHSLSGLFSTPVRS